MCSVSKVSRQPLGARSGQAKEDLAAIPYFVRFYDAARIFSQRSAAFENGGRDRRAIAETSSFRLSGALT
jgi:hypothetical protein